mgnify:CR=1 FL=1
MRTEIDPSDLCRALNGRWRGNYGTAACPVCQRDRRADQDALTIGTGDDGRLLLHCKRAGCAFADVLTAAGVRPGAFTAPDPLEVARRLEAQRAQEQKRADAAARTWAQAQPIGGTVAEAYLRGRGIRSALGPALRFHPRCLHGPTGQRLPAMVARIAGGEGVAIHRTYLRPDGSGKAAVTPSKAMLGSARGGAVRLLEGPRRLLVAEGIETALSAAALLEDPATVWAALSASGMQGLTLPPLANGRAAPLIVAVDGDDAGRAAGRALAQRATATGWHVKIADPGDGLDFNDLTQAEGAA